MLQGFRTAPERSAPLFGGSRAECIGDAFDAAARAIDLFEGGGLGVPAKSPLGSSGVPVWGVFREMV